MSYILEALKKAEQKRQREGKAGLVMFSGETVPKIEKRFFWPCLILAALLLNALAITLWVASKGNEKKDIPYPQTVAADQAAPLSAEAGIVDEGHPGEAGWVARKEGGGIIPAPVHDGGDSDSKKVSQGRPETEAEPPVVAERHAMVEKIPQAGGRILSLDELPPSIRGGLPEFRVSGHAYSPDPMTRVVRVNEKILLEGQELGPGLRVQEIVQGGIVFTFEGYRFHVSASERR